MKLRNVITDPCELRRPPLHRYEVEVDYGYGYDILRIQAPDEQAAEVKALNMVREYGEAYADAVERGKVGGSSVVVFPAVVEVRVTKECRR